RMEHLPRPAPAGADDERRPVLGDVLEHVGEGIVSLLGDERHRRLTLVRPDEGCPAPRAEVRGLGVLEPALGAVDVAHVRSAYEGGADFPSRISVSDSTSTCSSTLFPSVFCRRATSSARRMSIFPCRMRRW